MCPTDGALYLSGLVNGEGHGEGWHFKSSGNVDGGQALWQKITAAEIAANAMPSSVTIVTHTSAMSFKSMKPAKDGFVAIGQNKNDASVIVKLSADGRQVWATQCVDCGEFTSVATSLDGTEFAVGGHCSFDIDIRDGTGCVETKQEGNRFSGLDAAVTYFNSDGQKKWTKRYPTPHSSIQLLYPSDQVVVYEETWSITSTPDGGFVLGCGSGTHCSEVPSTMKTSCLNANMEKWQSLVTKLAADGTLVWQRVDTQDPDKPTADMGAENAVEYVTVNADGTYLVTHDDTNGMGYSILAADKPTTPLKVVLIGDSMSEYAKQSMDKYCPNTKSTNKGIGGTTAQQVRSSHLSRLYPYLAHSHGHLSTVDAPRRGQRC